MPTIERRDRRRNSGQPRPSDGQRHLHAGRGAPGLRFGAFGRIHRHGRGAGTSRWRSAALWRTRLPQSRRACRTGEIHRALAGRELRRSSRTGPRARSNWMARPTNRGSARMPFWPSRWLSRAPVRRSAACRSTSISPQCWATRRTRLPRLTINLFSGGMHAGRQVAIQDVLIVPARTTTIDESLAMAYDVYQAAAALILKRYGMRLLTADEGGLAPPCDSAEELIEIGHCRRSKSAGYRPGSGRDAGGGRGGQPLLRRRPIPSGWRNDSTAPP